MVSFHKAVQFHIYCSFYDNLSRKQSNAPLLDKHAKIRVCLKQKKYFFLELHLPNWVLGTSAFRAKANTSLSCFLLSDPESVPLPL